MSTPTELRIVEVLAPPDPPDLPPAAAQGLIRILQAAAWHARRDERSARNVLTSALERADVEGHVRLFLHAGAAVTGLVRSVASAPAATAHARRVLAAIEGEAPGSAQAPAPSPDTAEASPSPPATRERLVDPLSARELDVLRLLRSDLSGPEIARELYVYGAATALISAAEASLRVWIQRTDGELTPETLRLRQELLAQAIERLGAGFDSDLPPAPQE